MADELKDQRVVTMMTPSELAAIDDWAFANRIRSRGEAIRRLCRIAIAADREVEPVHRALYGSWQQLGSIALAFGEFLETEKAPEKRDGATMEFLNAVDRVILLLDDAATHSFEMISQIDPLRSNPDLTKALEESEAIKGAFTAALAEVQGNNKT